MDRAAIEAEIRRLSPWYYRFDLGGVSTAITPPCDQHGHREVRLPPAAEFLLRGRSVLAREARERALRSRVPVRRVLYHLTEPWKTIQQFCPLAREAVFVTCVLAGGDDGYTLFPEQEDIAASADPLQASQMPNTSRTILSEFEKQGFFPAFIAEHREPFSWGGCSLVLRNCRAGPGHLAVRRPAGPRRGAERDSIPTARARDGSPSMPPRSRSRLLAPVLLVIAGACHGGSSGSGAAAPSVTNTGHSGAVLLGTGELKVLVVLEALEQADLDGDGDQFDQVAVLYNLADGSRVDTGLALASFAVAGDVLIAFDVSEFAQGQTDLNDDGDAEDDVLHVFDRRTQTVTNTGLAFAGAHPAIGAGLVVFGVSEFAQGQTDLDENGSIVDNVLHVFDSRTGQSSNAHRAITSGLVFHGHEFAFTTRETTTDLNGDGDTADGTIFQVFDWGLGGVLTVGVESLGMPLAAGDDWFALVSEPGQGVDLNGDGDMLDGVYHVLHPHFGTSEPLALSSNIVTGAVGNGELLVLPVQEIDGVDRNGDGDMLDSLWVVHDPLLGTSFDTGLIVFGPMIPPVFLGGRVALLAHELGQEEDLNGDGDQSDNAVFLVDPVLGTVDNLGLDCSETFFAAADRLLIARAEESDELDRNGDGDQLDTVFFAWDSLTGGVTHLGLATMGRSFGTCESRVLLIAPEASEGRDLNGDGDEADFVIVVHQLATGVNHGLALATATFDEIGLTQDGRGAFLVLEDGQDADLNGDGDQSDGVLHVLR